MEFHVISRDAWVPQKGKDTAYLKTDYWNDYSFVTMFNLSYHDEEGEFHDIGATKIGFRGQTDSDSTHRKMPRKFSELPAEFFSLGQSTDFYRNLHSIPADHREQILRGLRDIVFDPTILGEIENEEVLGASLLRHVSLTSVKGQFSRLLQGMPELTDFKFKYQREPTADLGGVDLSFKVIALSMPSTNIHALIGRNGVGKTTVLNGMIDAIIRKSDGGGKFMDVSDSPAEEIASDYFSSLISVSFSAFDPFSPPSEQSDPRKGTCYFYVGLKDRADIKKHRAIEELQGDCVGALVSCFSQKDKLARWKQAIDKLGSDEIFSSLELSRLYDIYRETRPKLRFVESEYAKLGKHHQAMAPILSTMSSGHAVVLLTVSKLVATLEEKTLVLIDEPESHLHPPLLSAFVRALAELLHDRNGVAIIATHSPVVLQEIPKSCVWKIYRVGKNIRRARPDIETFAENVGVLTSEVFGLEVERSGFHYLLSESVASGKEYDEIIEDYKEQLGLEGRALLRALLAEKGSQQ